MERLAGIHQQAKRGSTLLLFVEEFWQQTRHHHVPVLYSSNPRNVKIAIKSIQCILRWGVFALGCDVIIFILGQRIQQ